MHVSENASVLVFKDGSLPDLLRKAAEEIEEQAQLGKIPISVQATMGFLGSTVVITWMEGLFRKQNQGTDESHEAYVACIRGKEVYVAYFSEEAVDDIIVAGGTFEKPDAFLRVIQRMSTEEQVMAFLNDHEPQRHVASHSEKAWAMLDALTNGTQTYVFSSSDAEWYA